MMKRDLHFVGFRGEEFHSAVKVWGKPDFFHRVFDDRVIFGGEVGDDDIIIFANVPMVPMRGTKSSLSTIVRCSKMIIKLTGKTNHGKNRVREHGDLWEVLEVPTGVLSMTHKPSIPPIRSAKT